MRWLIPCLAFALLLPTTASADMGRGRQTYNRLWRKADRFYGANGQPPPRLHRSNPGSLGSMLTEPAPDGGKRVLVKPWEMRALAGKTVRPGAQREAEKNLLHEWAHVYQDPGVVSNPDRSVSEYDASHFAQAVAKRILAKKGKRQKLPIDRSQFGSNYGANPRTIRWPSS